MNMYSFTRKFLEPLPQIYRDFLSLTFRGSPHEQDFYLYAHLNGLDGLFVDVGANWGQSATSLFFVNRTLRLLSLEPNTALRGFLLLIWMQHPLRFRFLMAGAGETSEIRLLNIPVAGSADLRPNASFDSSEFEKDYVKERLKQYAHEGIYSFKARRARIVALDTLNLAPLVIKIDVEGWEEKALKGMETTLDKHHPVLMIEQNNREVVYPWLVNRGYQFYRYQQQPEALIPIGQHEACLNAICLHPDMPESLRARLGPLMQQTEYLREVIDPVFPAPGYQAPYPEPVVAGVK